MDLPRDGSLPLMDLDSLPDELVGVDDMFVDNYLKGVEADAMVSGVLPSLNLDQDAWLGSPAMQPGQMHMGKDATFYSQHQQQQQLKRQSQPPLAPQARTSHDFVKTASAGSSHSHEHASVDSEEAEDAKGKGGRRSRAMAAAARKVTPQRKQNNRKAQQRYREKRKAQAQELEVKVALLTTELEKMKAVQGQASQLAEENARLRAALGEQQETTQVLKADQAEDSDSWSPKAKEGPSYDDVVAHLYVVKRSMQELLQGDNIPVDSVRSDRPKQPDTAQELDRLLGLASKGSVQQMLLAPMCPKEKVLRHRAAVGAAHPCDNFRARWNRILLNINLNEAQQDVILRARQQMLDELRTIYEERNTLNQITMSIMLPRPTQHCSEEQKVYHGTTAVKMQCVERWGGGCMLSQSAELVAALDRLKANLSLERKMLLQMMELLLKKVLNPMQAAVMFIQAESDPVEPLHISNLVAIQKGLVEAPPRIQLDPQQDAEFMRPFTNTGRADNSAANTGQAAGSGSAHSDTSVAVHG